MSDEEPIRCRTLIETPAHVDGETLLWRASLDIALARIESIKKFAREWQDIRFNLDYDRRRTLCVFHLSWLFDDTADAHRWTFAGLCQFAQSPALADVKTVRKAILRDFLPQALESLAQPVDPLVMNSVTLNWLSNGPMVNAVDRRGGLKIADDELAAVAGDEFDLGWGEE